MERVVRDQAALAQVIAGLRTNGKSVVLAAGSFEVIHPGHVRFLADAASRGDYLVVALQDDASVRKEKGAGRPVQPASDRAEVVIALPRVHYVTFFSGPDARELCSLLRPTVFVRGRDCGGERNVPEREAAEAAGCRVVIVGDAKTWSTDRILGRKPKKKTSPKARARA